MKTKNYFQLFLLTFTFISITVFSQPAIQWQKSFGGTQKEVFVDIKQTADGGYIAGGSSRSSNGDITAHHGTNSYNDYWIVKLNATGNIQWEKSIGGSHQENLKIVNQTSDGGYIIGGNCSSNDGDVIGHHGTAGSNDYWIVKLDSFGNIQWQKPLGGTGTEDLGTILFTNDGGYIIGGKTGSNDGDVTGNHGNSDIWLVKLDATGNMQWQKTLGGSDVESFSEIKQNSNGDYLILASSYSNDGNVSGHHGSNLQSDYWVVKLNNLGNIIWQKSFGGTLSDASNELYLTTDGCIVAGESGSVDGDIIGHHGNAGSTDIWVVKLDGWGNIQWQKSLGGSQIEEIYFHNNNSLFQTTDGGYIINGTTNSNDGDVTGFHGLTDLWVVKLNNNGSIQWQQTLGGSSSDVFGLINMTSDGGYIVGGNTQSSDGDLTFNYGLEDYWVVKLSSTGNIQWQKSMGGPDIDRIETVREIANGGYIVGGWSKSYGGNITNHFGDYDYWLVELAPVATSIETITNSNNIIIYPNPTSNLFNINFTESSKNRMVEVYNLLGEKILSHQANELERQIDLQNYPSGIYFIKMIENNEQVYTQKIIKQ